MSAPPAVVVGLDCITGLQTARILAGREVPVIGLAGDPGHYACRTRACTRAVQADLVSADLVEALVRLGPSLSEPAALFPCTDLAVLQISRHRERLAPWFRMALPEHAVVERLMDKVGFLRHAQATGVPIPGTVIIEDRADAERAAATLSYPVAVKPPMKTATWQAHTNVKAFQVRNRQELLDVHDRVGSWAEQLIAQEWVAGGVDSLYSCNTYFDRNSRPLVSFVARKLRQWPAETGTSTLGEECRNDEVLQETLRLFAGVGYVGLGYVEMKRDARTGRHLVIEPNIGRPTGRSAIAEAGGVELVYTAYCDMVGRPLPPAREQRFVGTKWIDDRRDLQSALYALRRGTLTPGGWWRSVRGPKAHAVLSWSDPLPFAHELLQTARKGGGVLASQLASQLASRPASGPASRGGRTPGSADGAVPRARRAGRVRPGRRPEREDAAVPS